MSNCLVVAIIAWLRDPLHTRIYALWEPARSWCPHFYWRHRKRYIHFRIDEEHPTWWQMLWHRGKVKPFRYHKCTLPL